MAHTVLSKEERLGGEASTRTLQCPRRAGWRAAVSHRIKPRTDFTPLPAVDTFYQFVKSGFCWQETTLICHIRYIAKCTCRNTVDAWPSSPLNARRSSPPVQDEGLLHILGVGPHHQRHGRAWVLRPAQHPYLRLSRLVAMQRPWAMELRPEAVLDREACMVACLLHINTSKQYNRAQGGTPVTVASCAAGTASRPRV